MSVAISDRLRFGPFVISLRRRTLFGAEGPVSLSSRAFDLLVALIERRDAVVTKDELIRAVWNNLVVEENNLHVQIAAIRRALGEHQDCIKTIPGKGYRFIADLVDEFSGPVLREAREPPAPNGFGGLPAELTALVGREEELEAIAARIEVVRLFTLVGPGGVGKTRLALAAARAAVCTARARAAPIVFADGAALAELGSLPPGASVPAAIAASLRVEELYGKSLDESIVMALRQRAMLLVLDGCEHVEAAPFAALLLRECPQLRILCTSQAPLGLKGETIRRISPLAVPDEGATAAAAGGCDSVRLFVERAAAGDGRFVLNDATVESVVAICRGLDGIPLAIELAASRVALLGLEPVRLRLGDRLALLGEAAGDRRRTLGAAIEWSFGLLAEPDRLVLRRLSVFAGGFTLAAAREVAAGSDLTEAEVEQGVENLARRSLLTSSPDPFRPRHRMLQVMRNFALGALAEAGEQQEAQRRHATYFCRLAHAAERQWETSAAAEWTAPFAAELENLRAALDWALSPGGDPLLAARLAAATARIWFEGTYLREGEGWLARALAGAPPGLEAATLINLKRGLAGLRRGDAALAQEAMVLAAAEGDAAAEGRCARELASVLIDLGRHDEAERIARRAFDLLRHSGQERTFARCLMDLSILGGLAGDYAAARRYSAEARARLTALGDDLGAAVCLQHAAEFEFADHDVDAAAALAAESVALFRPMNRRFDLQVSLGNLAAYLLAVRDFSAARAAAAEALVIGQQIEDELGVVIAIEHLAMVAAGTGAPETAARLLGHAEAARGAMRQERQKTEEITHGLLLAALQDGLSPARRESLELEGRYLSGKAAAAQALKV